MSTVFVNNVEQKVQFMCGFMPVWYTDRHWSTMWPLKHQLHMSSSLLKISEATWRKAGTTAVS